MQEKPGIAIVGIGGIFPGADNPEILWQNILNRVDCSRRPPEGRWSLELDDVYDPNPGIDKVYSDRACFVEDPQLDTGGLDIDPELLDSLDPMFRLLIYAGRQAWRDCNTSSLDRNRTGIIIGNIALPTDTSSQLAEELLGDLFIPQAGGFQREAKQNTNRLNRYVAGLPAGLLAKSLGLGGCSYTLDAACASSLYSLKYAVDELLSRRTDAMLCGGLSRPDSLYTQMGFSTLGAVSPSGRCSPFDSKADGLVVGEGCGIIVLKRLEDALKDQDHIYATIAGIGLSNDIAGNLMLPDSEGQLRAMKAAYQQAGWAPHDIDLIECHGTGTPAGDRTEFTSMQALWGSDFPTDRNCVIGSVKSNIGHLLTAAGSAGLIKVLLAIKHGTLPPMANYDEAPQELEMDTSPFTVLKEGTEWHLPPGRQSRRAAVSAFGFGGINAHILLEEYSGNDKPVISIPVESPDDNSRPCADAIAITGIDTHIGPWKSKTDFLHRVLGDRSEDLPSTTGNRWGVKGLSDIKGFTIDQVDIPLGRFRIPPKELKDMLPQQLLMLNVAANALDDAGLVGFAETRRTDAGVFIGIGLDLNTTNFHLRWSMLDTARNWVKQQGVTLSDTEFSEWLGELRDGVGPPLSADRTMGALGGIVASRIARAFNIGGPSFTLSSEECSGMHALEMAVRTLRRRELNVAIAGAVDLGGDVRALDGQEFFKPFNHDGQSQPFDRSGSGSLIGEGAVALVLKRYQDALADGDQVYGIITGTGSATGGDTVSTIPDSKAYQTSVSRACTDAGILPETISYIETHGSGDPLEDQLEFSSLQGVFNETPGYNAISIASAKTEVGHCGAASGLVSVARAALSLHHKILPPLSRHRRSESMLAGNSQFTASAMPRYWLCDNGQTRRAMISSIGIGGNCNHAILEEAPQQGCGRLPHALTTLRGRSRETLFSIRGNDRAQLQQALARLENLRADSSHHDVHQLSSDWFHMNKASDNARLAVSIISHSHEELRELIARASESLGNDGEFSDERMFFSSAPLAEQGQVAFVFPGSGNHFVGMGQEPGYRWPEVLQSLETENNFLASQFSGARLWNPGDITSLNNEEAIFAQVWLGTFMSDVVSSFGIRPDAIIGYSLGETAGLFATRTWKNRDLMFERMQKSSLFKTQLAGPCEAARKVWGLSNYVDVDWCVGVVNSPAETIKKRIERLPWLYLLIVNTPDECVIGGNRIAVESLVSEFNLSFHPVDTITTVHCELARPVQQEYRALHLFETQPPDNMRFYSCIKGGSYAVTRDSAADSITNMAIESFDFTRVINSAYDDGVRVFVEMGPGASCTRMIDRILGDRTHIARSVCIQGRSGVSSVLQTLAMLNSHGFRLDLTPLYNQQSDTARKENPESLISVRTGHEAISMAPPAFKTEESEPAVVEKRAQLSHEVAEIIPHPSVSAESFSDPDVIEQMILTESVRARTHETYLRVSNGINQTLTEALSLQLALLQEGGSIHQPLPDSAGTLALQPQKYPGLFMDRQQCLEFATGSIAAVLGEKFADIDTHPTRVRLPDEPLMLVDRILEVEGEPDSMTSGRVVTEHDIHSDAWYLDGGRIPTCIAVESGQADLFLSGYLGIDHITHGLAVYRLLDAEITFHGPLPSPGQTIRYDIRIDNFFKQGNTYLFRFNFDGTVNGEKLLTMRNGCAGFFTQAELNAGRGIVQTELERRTEQGRVPEDWQAPVAMIQEGFDDTQLDALRDGDLKTCFGPLFEGLQLSEPVKLPGGRMTLVHRILDLNPQGGRFGLGTITGEADIKPDDWFLTCHFVDDQVMPGTLMYECCLHTLRVYLMRMGWIAEHDEIVYEPVPGISSKLKCRGQVTAETQRVQYEIILKELGYREDGTPYVIADALMYADQHPIVQMDNMSLQLSGLTRNRSMDIWQPKNHVQAEHGQRSVLFDSDSILAFAVGKPSVAFGDRYLPFDSDRVIARLPGPPYQFLDRIVSIKNCEKWQLKAGGEIVAEYDVPDDAWYFSENRQSSMPYSVLLEVALQPCGWLAAYLGSALTSETDLSFRNLGGNAVQSIAVSANMGTLQTRVRITSVSISGGMIIQNFDFKVCCKDNVVFQGDTYFGFFSKQALSNQVGIRDASLYVPGAEEENRSRNFDYPDLPPYPATQMRMVDRITFFDPAGGPAKLGYIRGSARVDPDAWFFKAHFYQDPVWPGSLGLESFIQLLKVAAIERWRSQRSQDNLEFESMVPGYSHQWLYRGQIIPENTEVIIEAVIKDVDNENMQLKADGHLCVDGRIIYQMIDFSLRIKEE